MVGEVFRVKKMPQVCCASLLLLSVPALAQGPQAGELYVPPSYDPSLPAPLLVLLHGYGSNGAQQEAYMRFAPLADEFGFIFLNPNGTLDQLGNRFWNATDACCDFFGSGIDHSGQLRSLITTTQANFSIDSRRIWLVGHSNGGFMSYRMACEHADLVAAIASLAGASFFQTTDCVPSLPVHVLQMHGTNDTTILYNGGNILGNPYPGAVGSVERWATYDGCSLNVDTSAPPLDLDSSLPGAETSVARYTDACNGGGSAELWTIVGGSHVPNLSSQFSRTVVEWLYDHPKLGAGSNYCTSTQNSSGAAAIIDAYGSASIAANDLCLVARNLPIAQFGLFYYGPEMLDLPFGNGRRCVGGGSLGIFRLPVQQVSNAGLLVQPMDYTQPPTPDGQILPGSTWRFQCWFRDPPAGGAFFDLSDGYSISFF